MARNYEVHLTKTNSRIQMNYPRDFFPRPFHYKSEAVKMVQEVLNQGGEAEVRKPKGVSK